MIPKAVSARSSLVATALAGLVLLLILRPLAVGAQDEGGQPAKAPGGDLVTIDATDASLGELLRMLSRAADVKIVLAVSGTDKTVTVNLPNVNVETALQAIVEAAGCYWDLKEGGIYVVTNEPPPGRTEPPGPGKTEEPESIKVTPPSSKPGGTEIAPVPVGPPTYPTGSIPPEPVVATSGPLQPPAPPQPPQYTTQLIPLQYADPVQVTMMLGGTVPPNSSALYTQRPGRRSAGPAWQYGGGGNTAGVQPGNWFGSLGGSRSGDFRDSFNQLGGLGGGFGGGGLGGRGGGMGGLGGGLGGGGLGGGLGGGYGGGLGGGMGGRGGGGYGGGGFTALLPEEITAISTFMDDNSLIVRGTAEAIDEVRELVALLDKPVKQVEIAVKFVSITTTFEEAFGIDWAIKNTRIEVFNQGFAPPQAINSVVRFATGNLDAQLNALEKSSRATVIQEPRVAVQNNGYAYVEFGTEIPVYTANVTYNQFGQRTVDFTMDAVDVENYLEVQPRVNADDSVSLWLTPQISNVTGYVEAPDGSRAPIMTYQTVMTMLRVQDGETAVIGGLVTKDDSSTKLRTPLLSKIPFIGKLFDSRAKNLNDTELLIFVTPRILHDVPTD